MVTLEENPQIKVSLHGKKQINQIYSNCNLEKILIFFKTSKIINISKWALAHFFLGALKMLNRGLDKLELLRIVEAVANEKSIDKELVIDSMESAIKRAALTKFGNDNNIEVNIDRESGDIKIQKVLEVVESVEDTAREITLEDAQKIDKKKDLKNWRKNL